VPLTHRGIATSVRFLTGHSRNGGEEALDETTDASVDAHTTLVVYMGLATLPELTRRLTAAGAFKYCISHSCRFDDRPICLYIQNII